MRLPAGTPKQRQCEEARQWSERIYGAYLLGRRVRVPSGATPQKELMRIASNHHKFWNSRGFRLRVRHVAPSIEVWIEPRPAREVA